MMTGWADRQQSETDCMQQMPTLVESPGRLVIMGGDNQEVVGLNPSIDV